MWIDSKRTTFIAVATDPRRPVGAVVYDTAVQVTQNRSAVTRFFRHTVGPNFRARLYGEIDGTKVLLWNGRAGEFPGHKPNDTMKYFADRGKRCPNCSEANITITDIIHPLPEMLKAIRPMTCQSCGAEWNEVYEFVQLEEVEP